MRGDGDGWVVSHAGTRHWGRHGAAGLLLRAPLGEGRWAVLLQHRAPWSHQGGTWGLPGGARDSHETPEEAALREAHEEAGLPREHLQVRFSVITAEVRGPRGVHWTYTTVIAEATEKLPTVLNQESTALSWVALEEVTSRNLHPGFEASWNQLSVLASNPEL